ncbi:maleylacetate reductase [Sphingobium xenophagum]|uniref:maleylacetate reductase n=1 Tax=Sphingobium xenophagum TaxID=121428 RepID=UPI000364A93C|nr:maleylacetate reductase [Sphingobium xenophagum]
MGIEPFIYKANPGRVVFGAGTRRQLSSEVEALGLGRVVVLSTPDQAEQAWAVAESLGGLCAGTFHGAAMHTPVEVTNEALRHIEALAADGVVSIGGGSTIGLGKAVALRTDLPQIVLPTTYAGSEMTPILGETENARKVTKTDPRILPEVVVYDVELTLTLPAALSATSGINAMAHAVEALYARERNPVISLMAQEGIRAFAKALPIIVDDPANVEARSEALYGAWLCGTCLGAVGMALHHKLCHTLGGTFNLPHAETHAILLPHSVAYNAPATPYAMDAMRMALGQPDPVTALYELTRALKIPAGLRNLGMAHDGVALAAKLAVTNSYWNPRPLEENEIRATIERAWAGERPLAGV